MAKNNGPKKEKPKPIEIGTIRRTRKAIQIHWTQGDSKFDLNERDNPLPGFNAALDALAPVVGTICKFSPHYCSENLRVVGLVMGEQGGARSVSLMARKGIADAAKEFSFVTPARLLDHPSEPGSYTPPLTADEIGLVEEAIEQGKLYVRGDRAQGQIAFEDDDESDDGSGETAPEKGEELPLDPPAPPAKKRRSRKLAAAAAK